MTRRRPVMAATRLTLPIAAIVLAAMTAASCSGAATGPTTALNTRLIARFDSLSTTSQRLHSDQLLAMVGLLEQGTPVGHATFVVNGQSSTYSIIARYAVSDSAEVPHDSMLTVFAWSGDDADTVVEFEYAPNSIAALVTDPDSLFVSGAGPSTGTPMVSHLGAVCTSFFPSVHTNRVGLDANCRIEGVVTSAAVVLDDSPAPDVNVSMPVQSITAIRVNSATTQ
jgi:hypothetical protein